MPGLLEPFFLCRIFQDIESNRENNQKQKNVKNTVGLQEIQI